jgi:hypothetical protein
MGADEFPASYWSQESSSRLPIGHSFIMFYKRKEDFLQKFLTGQTLGMSGKKWPPSFVFFGQQVYNTVSTPNMLSGSTLPPSLSE